MAQFQFRVEDQAGRVRAGRITANSLEDARKRMLDLGMKVLELRNCGSPSEVTERSTPTSSGLRISAVEPVDVSIRWDSRWYEFWERYPRERWEGPVGKALIALFALGFLVWLRSPRASLTVAPAARASSAPLHSVNVTLSGAVQVDGVQDLGDVVLLVDFPDIPFQFSSPWKDLDHPSSGRYRWQVAVKSQVQPKSCVVRAVKPDYRESSLRRPLASPTAEIRADLRLSR